MSTREAAQATIESIANSRQLLNGFQQELERMANMYERLSTASITQAERQKMFADSADLLRSITGAVGEVFTAFDSMDSVCGRILANQQHEPARN